MLTKAKLFIRRKYLQLQQQQRRLTLNSHITNTTNNTATTTTTTTTIITTCKMFSQQCLSYQLLTLLSLVVLHATPNQGFDIVFLKLFPKNLG
uniref:Uncharacterized protein n=1 Tax=Glossina brevipalpis TaxID=37001 RepID=A0A1A9W2L1_9MUSC